MTQALDWARSRIREREQVTLSDAELVTSFLESRDESAFAAIVKRHGPLVLGVCNSFLHNHHDAEDAFQAVFLVLLKRAESIRPRAQLANWLYGVAYKTAYRTRQYLGKQTLRERAAALISGRRETPELQSDDFWLILDQELNRLPSKYRAPIVLCDLGGKSRREAARLLGLLDGTLSGRLTRGRRLLAARLGKRGLSFSGSVMAALLVNECASAAIPHGLAATTIRSVFTIACNGAVLSNSGNVAITSISQGVIHSMYMTKLWQAVSVVFVTVTLVGASSSVLAFRGSGPGEEPGQEALVRDGAGPAKQDSTTNSQKRSIRLNDKQAKTSQIEDQRTVELRRQEWELRWKEFVAGRGVFDFLLVSSFELGQAELVLARSHEERIEALKAELMRAFDIWEVNQRRYVAGKLVTQDLAQSRGYYESVRDRKLSMLLHGAESFSVQDSRSKRELKLAMELVDVATHAWNSHKLAFEIGQGSQAQVLYSAKQLRDAQLRTRASAAERETALRAHLDRVRRIEEIADRRFKAGQRSESELYDARYTRIEAELDLEQAGK
jgi:RNA polymerase sigma factor (sigma-70 family)